MPSVLAIVRATTGTIRSPVDIMWGSVTLLRIQRNGIKMGVMTPHGVNASSFYGFAPMHTHPYAIKVAL